MKRLLMWIGLVILTGCAGGGRSSSPSESNLAPASGVLPLRLTASAEAGTVMVELTSPAACDLYQLAGGISYDAEAYTYIAAEPGGAFGGETESYFAAGETAPGQVDFAYTMRFHGPGITGEVELLRLEFQATGGFNPADFVLNADPAAILARDSAKAALEIQLVEGVR